MSSELSKGALLPLRPWMPCALWDRHMTLPLSSCLFYLPRPGSTEALPGASHTHTAHRGRRRQLREGSSASRCWSQGQRRGCLRKLHVRSKPSGFPCDGKSGH